MLDSEDIKELLILVRKEMNDINAGIRYIKQKMVTTGGKIYPDSERLGLLSQKLEKLKGVEKKLVSLKNLEKKSNGMINIFED